MPSTLRILLICDCDPTGASAVMDHIEALASYSRHTVLVWSGRGDIPAHLRLDRFDVVVIHYSTFLTIDSYLSPLSRYRIRLFAGTKAVFLHDEYKHVHDTIDVLNYLRVDILFSCVPRHDVTTVYRGLCTRAKIIPVLTGYVPKHLVDYPAPKLSERAIDVGYRGRIYPDWLGQIGREKSDIGVRFERDAKSYALRCDISVRERARLYGERWISFLTRCKAVLGVESGASDYDFTGSLEASYRENARKAYHAKSQIGDQQGEKVRLKLAVISPRIFEAIALRTHLILYEGEYSGVIHPLTHYTPLRKDHSNMQDVVAALRNPDLIQEATDRAFNDVALNPRYRFEYFVRCFDRHLDSASTSRASARDPYTSAEFIASFGDFRILPTGHVLRSRLSHAFIVAGAEWLLPMVPVRYRELLRNRGKSVARLLRGETSSRSRDRFDRFCGGATLSDLERAEIAQLKEWSFRLGEFARALGYPTLTVEYVAGRREILLLPGSVGRHGGTPASMDVIISAFSASAIDRVEWVPGTKWGLERTMNATEPRTFFAVAAALTREPSLCVRLFGGRACEFRTS